MFLLIGIHGVVFYQIASNVKFSFSSSNRLSFVILRIQIRSASKTATYCQGIVSAELFIIMSLYKWSYSVMAQFC